MGKYIIKLKYILINEFSFKIEISLFIVESIMMDFDFLNDLTNFDTNCCENCWKENTEDNLLNECFNCNSKYCKNCDQLTSCEQCNISYCKNCNFNLLSYSVDLNLLVCNKCSDEEIYGFEELLEETCIQMNDIASKHKMIIEHREHCNLWECNYENCGGRKKNGSLNKISFYK